MTNLHLKQGGGVVKVTNVINYTFNNETNEFTFLAQLSCENNNHNAMVGLMANGNVSYVELINKDKNSKEVSIMTINAVKNLDAKLNENNQCIVTFEVIK